MLEKLIEQGRAGQSLLQETLKGMSTQFGERVQQFGPPAEWTTKNRTRKNQASSRSLVF